jgi:tight adherence protein C
VELYIVPILIAVSSVLVSAALYLALRPHRVAVERLKASGQTISGPTQVGSVVKSPDRLSRRKRRRGIVKLPVSLAEASAARKLLHHAGFRSDTAFATYGTIRLACMVGMPAAFGIATLYVHVSPGARFMGLSLLLLAGYMLPRLALRWLAKRRQNRLRLSLPDALDLLVVCVEAGMGLNHAIVKVAEELEQTHSEISQEFKLVNLELRAGRPRAEALRHLGERTGVDDIVSLATILIQTDKFGTSVARSLRVHSDALRTQRTQRAEEAAAKTSIKLIFPLLFCIFPALLTVILGPAMLNLRQIFIQNIMPNVE